MVAKGEAISDDCNLHAAGSSNQCGGHDVRRGHRAARVLMMLINTQAVETKLLGLLKLVRVTVERGGCGRTRVPDPGSVRLSLLRRRVAPLSAGRASRRPPVVATESLPVLARFGRPLVRRP